MANELDCNGVTWRAALQKVRARGCLSDACRGTAVHCAHVGRVKLGELTAERKWAGNVASQAAVVEEAGGVRDFLPKCTFPGFVAPSSDIKQLKLAALRATAQFVVW